MPDPSAQAIAAARALPHGRVGLRAWLALGVLCFVYMLNFLDRQLLSILAKPVEDSLHISDGQLGRISGLYFAIFYGLISLPVGWLADRTHRVRILTLACAVWSAATVGCGLAASYAQLVVARMTVGFGEAGGVPPSYAIISDYFPPGRRGTALGIYNLGPPFGQAMGIAIGASIAAFYGWRPAFLVLGSVGVVAALLIIVAVREPRRGGLDPRPVAPPQETEIKSPGFGQTFQSFFSRPAFVLAAFASGATQMVTYGAGNFTALFLVREKGMSLSQMAVYYALVVGLFMSAGIFASGRATDHFTPRRRSAYGLIPAASLVCALPCFLAFVFAPHWPLAILFLAGPTFFNSFYLSCVVTLVQQEAPPEQRVLFGALLLLIMNMIGLGLGPTFVGAMSDVLERSHPGHGLQWALACLTPFYILAAGLFLALARMLRPNSQTDKDHRP